MDQPYHTTATPTITFNPYLPAIGRVLEVLCGQADTDRTVAINNRDLATAIGLRSAGHIPRILRALEADGHIEERITTTRGSLIVIAASTLILHADQSSIASQSDPGQDQAHGVVTPDRSEAADGDRSRMSDPPLHPPIRYLHDSMQQQHGAHTRSDSSDQGPSLNASEWQAIRSGSPGYSKADFERDLEKLATRDGITNPIGLIVIARSRGEPIYSQEELHARTPAHTPARVRPAGAEAPPNRARRSARAEERQQPPPLTPEYLQSRPRRGDRLRDVPGGGALAGG